MQAGHTMYSRCVLNVDVKSVGSLERWWVVLHVYVGHKQVRREVEEVRGIAALSRAGTHLDDICRVDTPIQRSLPTLEIQTQHNRS